MEMFFYVKDIWCYIYTTFQKFGVIKIVYVLKEGFSLLSRIYLIRNTVKSVRLWNIILFDVIIFWWIENSDE